MKIQKDFVLTNVLWYKIGGTAKYFLECKNAEDVKDALGFVRSEKIERIFILGLGSNLIFTDDYFDGAVIKLGSLDNFQNDIKITNGLVEVWAGTVLDDVIRFCFEKNLIGLEWAGGLPGTVGAGVRGNVGAFGGEIKDSIESVEVLDFLGTEPVLKTLTNKDLQFAYRDSLVKQNKKMVVVTARFRMSKSIDKEIEEAKKIYERNKQYRKDKHPLNYPNCGSVFKNIKKKEEVEKVLSVWPDVEDLVKTKWYGKVSMGYIIHKLGFEEFRIGDAEVSEKHNNFIINLGQARSADVLEIAEKIKKKVNQTFGFYPEIEVEIVA